MRPPSRPRVRGPQDEAARPAVRRDPARGPAAAWDDAPTREEIVEAELIDDDHADARDVADEVEDVEAEEYSAVDERGPDLEDGRDDDAASSREMVAVDPRAARSARLRATLASSRRGARGDAAPARGGSAGRGAVARGGSVAAGTGAAGATDDVPRDAPGALDDAAAGQAAGPAGSSVVSAGLAARLAEREAFERRRRLKRAGVVLAALVAVGALVWAIFLSPLFALDPARIEVTGASDYVDVAQVQGIAAQEGGTPLPRLSTGDLAARLSALPPVSGAVVRRDWPDGLSIELHSRTPVATAPDPEGVALVDGSGVVLAVVDAAPEGLPELTVPLAPAEATTTAARDARETVAAVLQVLSVLPDALRAQVATAGGSSPQTVTLSLHGGATVQWGSAADAELKAAVLEVLVEQQPARVYDVSVPDRPTTS